MEAKKVCCRTGSCGGSFPLPKHGRGVIVAIVDGVFPYVGSLDKDIVVCDGAAEFQVAVGDVAMGVVEGDQAVAYFLGEARSPENWVHGVLIVGDEVDAAHAVARSVTRSSCGRVVMGDQLGNSSGATGKVVC